jgi:hypothetical protein
VSRRRSQDPAPPGPDPAELLPELPDPPTLASLAAYPEVMGAMKLLEQALRARVGADVAFGLVVASSLDGQVLLRRLINCEPDLGVKLFQLAQLVPFDPKERGPWRLQ